MSVLRLLPVKHGELCVPSVYCNFKQAISVSFVIATYATSYNFKILSEWLSVHSPSKHVELKLLKVKRHK